MDLEKFTGQNVFKAIIAFADKNNLTINGVARKLGYPSSTLIRWRDGIVQPRLKTICELLKKAEKNGIKIQI